MPSLLDELRKHSTIDLDCNDDAGTSRLRERRACKLTRVHCSRTTVQAIPGHVRLAQAHRVCGSEPRKWHNRTSNQLIVLGQLKQESHASIMDKAVTLAKNAAEEFPGVELADLAVDFAVSGKLQAGSQANTVADRTAGKRCC